MMMTPRGLSTRADRVGRSGGDRLHSGRGVHSEIMTTTTTTTTTTMMMMMMMMSDDDDDDDDDDDGDDDLSTGAVRVRRSGGDRLHNGLGVQ